MSRRITVAAAQLGPVQMAEPRAVAVERMVRLMVAAHRRGAALVVFPVGQSARGIGGGGGIRTDGALSRTHAFQACALSCSAIPPCQATENSSSDAPRKPS